MYIPRHLYGARIRRSQREGRRVYTRMKTAFGHNNMLSGLMLKPEFLNARVIIMRNSKLGNDEYVLPLNSENDFSYGVMPVYVGAVKGFKGF